MTNEIIRKNALIDAVKMIYKYSDDYVERHEYSESAKADAWVMMSAATPIIKELGMEWKEVLLSKLG